MSAPTLPVVGLMLGDTTGIGPEQCAKILADRRMRDVARLVVVGDIRALTQGMRDAGVKAVHLGVGPKNERGVRFYRRYGFHVIEQAPEPWNTYWFGISTS